MTLPATAFHQGADQPRRATRGCAGCNRCSTARTTLRARANRPTCARRTRRKSLTSTATRSSDPMKPTPNSRPEPAAAAGLWRASRRHRIRLRRRDRAGDPRRAGRRTWSSARAAKPATHGTPAQRAAEAKKAAALLGATLEFIELDGDAHLEIRAAHAIKLAGIIRRRAAGHRARAERGRKPASRSFAARPTGARRGAAGPLRRR